MKGVLLPSGMWLNLDNVLAINFPEGSILLAVRGLRYGTEETGDVGPGYLYLDHDGDLDALWDYCKANSVVLPAAAAASGAA